jgi:hypothetical protein
VSQPTTFEEAAKRQRAIHDEVDAHAPQELRHDKWRAASLKEGYEDRAVPEYGTGYYSVNKETGEVCEWNGKWSDDGMVLLCQDCFLDGT